MTPCLPPLREDLALLPGPAARDGQPTWTVHDPARNQFFRIDWLSFEILSRWSLRDPALIAESIRTATTLQAMPEDVLAVARFIDDNQLVRTHGIGTAGNLARKHKLAHGGWARQALHNYLFFRIPLLRPDAWLTRLVPLVAPLFSRPFFILTLGALAAGGLLAWRQSDDFFGTLANTLNVSGLTAYAAAIFFVKIAHEFGHAFTAKRAGCRVPTMGVAFLVLWPVAYTDTNDTWRLHRRGDRLAVAIAGIVTELMLGAWALLAWGLLPPGELRNMCFVLSTSSLATTLAVNASPFMRFDGYFIACDWFDFPNLHQRSFDLARWHLRETLFAFGAPRPEHLPVHQERMLILFAWATWIYRLAIFLGIAALVYHFFIKLVGIILFAVEIGWFVTLPVWREFKAWRQLWGSATPTAARRRRSVLSLGLAVLVLGLVCAPWPGRIRSSGLLQPGPILPLYTSTPGRLAGPKPVPAEVTPGAVTLEITSAEIDARLAVARLEADIAQQRADRGVHSIDLRPSLPLLQRNAAKAQSEVLRWENERQQSRVVAPFIGSLRFLDPDLRTGDWIGGRHHVGSLIASGPATVETYLDEQQVKRVSPGDKGVFIIDSAAVPPLQVRVLRVDGDASRVLTDARLTIAAGGHLAARLVQRELVPEQAVYRVVLAVEDPLRTLAHSTWRGALVIRTAPFSPLRRYVDQALSVAWREAGW